MTPSESIKTQEMAPVSKKSATPAAKTVKAKTTKAPKKGAPPTPEPVDTDADMPPADEAEVKTEETAEVAATVPSDNPFEEVQQILLDYSTKLSETSKNISKELNGASKILAATSKKIGVLSKKMKKTKRKTNRTGETGFAKPGFISEQLANFLGHDASEQIRRTDVTKRITKYIQERNLQKADKKSIIDLDKPGGAQLKALLEPAPEPDTLTFFRLQKHLKHQFIKPERPAVVTA